MTNETCSGGATQTPNLLRGVLAGTNPTARQEDSNEREIIPLSDSNDCSYLSDSVLHFFNKH